jgi:uncharacterized protein
MILNLRRKVKMYCIHHNDLDGRCSAAIVNRMAKLKAFMMSPCSNQGVSIAFQQMDYKDAVSGPWVEELRDEDVIIVDFSFKPDLMAEIISIAKSVTWIDHHVTAKEYPYQNLPGLRDFEDKSKAGCELTWEYFFTYTPMPQVVKLIGDYDKWALKIPESIAFYEAMKGLDTAPFNPIWDTLFGMEQTILDDIIANGQAILQYRDQYCDKLCGSFGFETQIDGFNAYACNQFMFGSGGFGKRFKEYPICIAFIYDGLNYTVSLYSETVDVSQIAHRYGGGGHKGAAGFVTSYLPFGVLPKLEEVHS